MKKFCTDCNTKKPFKDFNKNKSMRYGLQHICRSCQKVRGKFYYVTHAAKRKENGKAWAKKNPEKARSHALKYLYNMTEEEYTKLLEEQGGCCAICLEPAANFSTKLCIDHDHNCCHGNKSCGKCVRGLLCGTCNKGVGYFKDDCLKLARAVQYLMKGKSGKQEQHREV